MCHEINPPENGGFRDSGGNQIKNEDELFEYCDNR
jgi:hypothetical protein